MLATERSVEQGDEAARRARWLRTFDLGATAEAIALPVVWVVLCIVFSILPETSHTFPTIATLGTVTGIGAVTVILTLGLLIPLSAGDFDLSVAATLTLSSMIVAILNAEWHMNIVLAILIAIAASAVVGLFNGVVTVMTEIDPFIITLGSATVIEGVVLLISDQNTIAGVNPELSNLLIVDRLLGLPFDFYFAVILALVVWFVLNYLPVGRRILYIGMGREVARLSGVAVKGIRIGGFVVAGVVAGIAGVVYTALAGSADPSSGTLLLLPAYAAAMLGATTIRPGRFNAWGSLIAVYFLGTGIMGLELLGASSSVQDLFYGTALILAVIFSTTVRRRRAQRLVERALEEGRAG